MWLRNVLMDNDRAMDDNPTGTKSIFSPLTAFDRYCNVGNGLYADREADDSRHNNFPRSANADHKI